jgi:fatty acid desaturase
MTPNSTNANPALQTGNPISASAPYPKILIEQHRSFIEWQTWLLIVVIYACWIGLVVYFDQIPIWLSTPLLIVVGAWYMSLQHELLHGHPTQKRWLNQLFGILPLAVWYPYIIYRDSHIQHHIDEDLTKPDIDSESNYLAPQQFARLNPIHQFFRLALRTSLGRFTLGPAWAIFSLLKATLQEFAQGNFKNLLTWMVHLILLVITLVAVQKYGQIPAWYYAGVIAYFTLGLAMMRSFYEHRPAVCAQDRIAINEAGLFWRLLYLNNNFHSIHHAYPALSWYAISKVYFQNKSNWLQVNNGFYISGYVLFLLKHFIKPVDHPEHPGFGL